MSTLAEFARQAFDSAAQAIADEAYQRHGWADHRHLAQALDDLNESEGAIASLIRAAGDTPPSTLTADQ